MEISNFIGNFLHCSLLFILYGSGLALFNQVSSKEQFDVSSFPRKYRTPFENRIADFTFGDYKQSFLLQLSQSSPFFVPFFARRPKKTRRIANLCRQITTVIFCSSLRFISVLFAHIYLSFSVRFLRQTASVAFSLQFLYSNR